jgi:hypothetical protein
VIAPLAVGMTLVVHRRGVPGPARRGPLRRIGDLTVRMHALTNCRNSKGRPADSKRFLEFVFAPASPRIGDNSRQVVMS